MLNKSAPPPPSILQTHHASLLVFATLVLCMSFGEVSTGLIVPAMPELGQIFNKTPGIIQLTIFSFAVFFALGQLFFGPFSDRKGRRLPLILGAILTLSGSICAGMSDDIWLIILGRAVQGLGAASGYVIARAIVRDIYGADGAAKAMAIIFALMSGGFLLAPLVGGFLLDFTSWRAVFTLASVGALFWLASIIFIMPETSPGAKNPGTEPIFSVYLGLFRHRGFLAFMITHSVAYAGLYCFVTGAPYLFIESLNIKPSNYGLIAAIVMSGFLVGSTAARYAIPRWGMNRVIIASLAIMFLASLVLFVLGLLGMLSGSIITIVEFIWMFGGGFIAPNTAAGVMMSHPKAAGAAAAVLGFVQMCAAAGVSLLQGIIYDGTIFPMVGTQLILGIIAWSVWDRLKKFTL